MARKPITPLYAGLTRKLRPLTPDDMGKTPSLVAETALDVRVQCTCGNLYPPDWHEPMKFEFSAWQSADGAWWIPITLPCECPACGKSNSLEVPASKYPGGEFTLYGDESYQWIDHKQSLAYVYAFVSLYGPAREPVAEAVKQAKLKIRPETPPEEWSLHANEVRNPSWRKKHRSPAATKQINSLLVGVAEALGANEENIILSASVYPPREPSFTRSDLEYVRDTTLTCGILAFTELMTRNGMTPHFVLEAQSLSHEENRIDLFVEKIGRDLHRSRMFHYVSRRKPVGLPLTAPKGSVVELELADLLAFAVRRYLVKGDRTEIPLEPFGTVTWGVQIGSGYGIHRAIGFPWNYVYKEQSRVRPANA